MLTGDDTPTIRRAVNRRLGTLPRTAVADIKFVRLPGVITVGLLLIVRGKGCGMLRRASAGQDEGTIVKSIFELPDPFEHGHLLEELDEIAEQCRAAARDTFLADLPVSEERFLPGTGRRGRWVRYGLRF